MREDERVQRRQGGHAEKGAGHGVQLQHSGHVEERVHARVLARPQIDELLLPAGQTDQAHSRTQDVRQGRHCVHDLYQSI